MVITKTLVMANVSRELMTSPKHDNLSIAEPELRHIYTYDIVHKQNM